MTVAALLVRLYPPAIGRRWGADIAREVDRVGPRTWFDTAAGAVRLWLHPSDWPETAVGQTRQVVVTALAVVSMTVALLLRAAGPAPPAVVTGHLTTGAWLVPVAAALLLAMPVLPLRAAAFGRLGAVAVRTLALPLLALTTLFLLAHSGLVDHPTGGAHALLLGYYWATLGFVGIRVCRFVARAGRIAVAPSTRRLRAALVLMAVGLALAGAQGLTAALRTGVHPGALALSCGLVALAVAVLAAGLDLRPAPFR
ncbi:MAG TPA: hypothetical protein VHF06_36265 [Pseudonocardiaceae bacterium]|nr:hypothetical protein [Pseudonocardiaceae bacterium]